MILVLLFSSLLFTNSKAAKNCTLRLNTLRLDSTHHLFRAHIYTCIIYLLTMWNLFSCYRILWGYQWILSVFSGHGLRTSRLHEIWEVRPKFNIFDATVGVTVGMGCLWCGEQEWLFPLLQPRNIEEGRCLVISPGQIHQQFHNFGSEHATMPTQRWYSQRIRYTSACP